MMMLFLLSAGTVLIVAALVIILLLLRAVGLLERIANAVADQNRSSDDVAGNATRDGRDGR